MLLIWPVVLAVVLGIFCSAWVRVLPFTLIVFAGIAGSVISLWASNFGAGWMLLYVLMVVVALEGGYFFGLVSKANRTNPPHVELNGAGAELPKAEMM
jgi:hypothetical protein